MNTCAEAFIAELKSQEFTCQIRETDNETIVTFPYENRRTNLIFAGPDGEHVQIMTILEKVPDEKYIDVVLACNQINSKYRFVKFVVDNDNDVVVKTDAILDTSSAASECFELLVRNLKIIDEAKPNVMKAIYS